MIMAEKIYKLNYHKNNFKSIGKLIEPLIKKHGHVNIISYSKLVSIWDTIVGEDISRKAQPIKIMPIKGGKTNILHLGLNGPYMAEISLQTQDIIEKINSIYLKEVISKIKLSRLHNIDKKNVVELDNWYDTGAIKSEEPYEPEYTVLQLESALKKLKNNLTNSRKKNEIMEDQ